MECSYCIPFLKEKRKGHNHRENEMTQQNKFIKLWNEWKKEKKGGDKTMFLKRNSIGLFLLYKRK